MLVYHAPFEATILRQLAERFPDLAGRLQAVIARIVDLLPIVKRNYYNPDMRGSWSLKAVLPTVAPDLDYADLDEVQDGVLAQVAYEEAIAPETSSERRETIRQPPALLRARHAGDGASGGVLPVGPAVLWLSSLDFARPVVESNWNLDSSHDLDDGFLRGPTSPLFLPPYSPTMLRGSLLEALVSSMGVSRRKYDCPPVLRM